MSVELYRPTRSLSFLYTQGEPKYTPLPLLQCMGSGEQWGAGTTNVENYKRGGEFI